MSRWRQFNNIGFNAFFRLDASIVSPRIISHKTGRYLDRLENDSKDRKEGRLRMTLRRTVSSASRKKWTSNIVKRSCFLPSSSADAFIAEGD